MIANVARIGLAEWCTAMLVAIAGDAASAIPKNVDAIAEIPAERILRVGTAFIAVPLTRDRGIRTAWHFRVCRTVFSNTRFARVRADAIATFLTLGAALYPVRSGTDQTASGAAELFPVALAVATCVVATLRVCRATSWTTFVRPIRATATIGAGNLIAGAGNRFGGRRRPPCRFGGVRTNRLACQRRSRDPQHPLEHRTTAAHSRERLGQDIETMVVHFPLPMSRCLPDCRLDVSSPDRILPCMRAASCHCGQGLE